MSLRSLSPGSAATNPETLIFPEGPVNEQTTLQYEEEFDVDAHYHLRRALHKDLPWYMMPSPVWLLIVVPLTAIAMSATLAPKIEIYTLIVCSVLKPEILHSSIPGNNTIGVGITHGLTYNTLFHNSTGGGLCAADPIVQAEVAKLAAVYTTSMGILSCITAGWWAAYSDRHGRTRLLSISVIGLLFTDLNFILTTKNFHHLPGGYWFLILGPIIEGSLGGVTVTTAAMYAYVADTTTENARSRTLSFALGLLFTGMAIGPSLGSLLVRFTGTPLSVFYAAFGIHLIYAFIVCLILPESLLKSQMEQSRVKHDAELRATSENSVGVLMRIKRPFSFLSSLSVLLPDSKEGTPRGNPLKRKRRDWNLTIVAGVYALAISVMGSYTTKFQYAAATFGWSSETLGYFLTLVGATRAFFLAIIIPCFIKLYKPQARPSSGAEAEPLLSGSPREAAMKMPHSTAFDLGLARVSLLVEVVSYSLMAWAPTPLVFTGSSMMTSMGAGLNPALQSVALALYRRRGGMESGRLFGAISVLQALSSQIISPAIYGLLYTKTVATFPRGIFILSMSTITCSFVLLMFVRLPSKNGVPASSDVEGDAVPTVSVHS
ncbi:hypothetical protein E4T56_gene5957 [Termitomyces sp. T112]|nr:hypothetical protein E4T56_gene5957 [Termitomyces sp. T112]